MKGSCGFSWRRLVLSGFALATLTLTQPASGDQSLAEKAEMFAQLGKLPLAKNPFFIKSIAMSGQFDGEGTEGMTPDFTGYSCRWIGNLECQAFKFQCDGSGIVDCTGTCPGDEEAVSKMMSMMEDKKLQEEFPLLAQMKAESEKDPAKAKAGKERFVKILKGCGFNGLVALAGLSDGIDFGASKDNDTSSVTHVDEGALAGFSYDYEEEEEDAKKMEDSKMDADKKGGMDSGKMGETDKGGTKKELSESKKEMPVNAEPEPQAEPEPVTEKKSSEQMKKEGEAVTSRSLENETLKQDLAKDEDNNTIDSESKEKELKSMPLNKDAAKPETEEQKLGRLHTEVKGLQQVLLAAVDEAEGKGASRRKRSPWHDDIISSLADRMKKVSPSLRRRIRSVAENMTANATVETEKCKVQNLSCVTFPTTAQCSGIAMGGCMSHRKLLASIFTPRVIMMVVGAIVVIVAIGVGIALYINKRKTNQSVEPAEAEDPNGPKGPGRAK